MKTSDLIDEAVSLHKDNKAVEVAWLKTAQRRLEDLRHGDVVAVEGEKVFMHIQDRYAIARK